MFFLAGILYCEYWIWCAGFKLLITNLTRLRRRSESGPKNLDAIMKKSIRGMRFLWSFSNYSKPASCRVVVIVIVEALNRSTSYMGGSATSGDERWFGFDISSCTFFCTLRKIASWIEIFLQKLLFFVKFLDVFVFVFFLFVSCFCFPLVFNLL